jgi:hypothetical protein
LPSLEDFYEEPGGAIAPGWYRASIVPGYATLRGVQFRTSDEPGQNGRRAFRLCFTLNEGGRTLQKTFFYDPTKLNANGVATVKKLREQFKGVKSWPGLGQEQNFSITLGNLSQLEKAMGFKLQLHPAGGVMANSYVGQQLDIRIGIDKNGYNDVTAFAQLGSKTAKKA